MDSNHLLTDQLDRHWRTQPRPRLDGLTDAEYRWEPVAGCWSLRPRGEETTPMAAGDGGGAYERPTGRSAPPRGRSPTAPTPS